MRSYRGRRPSGGGGRRPAACRPTDHLIAPGMKRILRVATAVVVTLVAPLASAADPAACLGPPWYTWIGPWIVGGVAIAALLLNFRNSRRDAERHEKAAQREEAAAQREELATRRHLEATVRQERLALVQAASAFMPQIFDTASPGGSIADQNIARAAQRLLLRHIARELSELGLDLQLPPGWPQPSPPPIVSVVGGGLRITFHPVHRTAVMDKLGSLQPAGVGEVVQTEDGETMEVVARFRDLAAANRAEFVQQRYDPSPADFGETGGVTPSFSPCRGTRISAEPAARRGGVGSEFIACGAGGCGFEPRRPSVGRSSIGRAQ